MQRRLSAIGLVVIGLLLTSTPAVLAFPPLPSSFYGTVKVDGENVPDGTIVSTWINGVKYAETTVLLYAGDTLYSLNVPGDDPATPGTIEGGVEGDTVVFYIGGLVADQTGTWHGGTNVSLDLTYSTGPVNNPPVAVNDAYSVDEGNTLTVAAPGVLANDTDADGDSLTAALASGSSHGTLTLNADGSFTYTHDGSENHSDTFTYTISDGNGGVDIATVTVMIIAAAPPESLIYLPLILNNHVALANVQVDTTRATPHTGRCQN